MKSVNDLYDLHDKASRLVNINNGSLTIELLDGTKIKAKVKALHFQKDPINPMIYGGIITFTDDINKTMEYSYDKIKDVK